MKSINKWEEFYQKTLLDKIPWQKTQADFLTDIINSKKIEVGTALDLGCGTGMKSIFLAKNGFKVIGVDISQKAIEYANNNANKENVEIKFYIKDATDLGFLGDKKFDLILDWANLHGIKKEKIESYIKEIIKHTKIGSKLVLRCFAYDGGKHKVGDHQIDVDVILFTEDDIKDLYGKNFKILEKNKSNSNNENAPSKNFNEFLMERVN